MKLIKTVDAEGAVLCHDITQIIRGVTKDAVFRKGHIVIKEDIPVLLSVGKDTLYVWEKEEGMLHEDDAAEVLDVYKRQLGSQGDLLGDIAGWNQLFSQGHIVVFHHENFQMWTYLRVFVDKFLQT